MRGSSGGGETRFDGVRAYAAGDVAVPEGYAIELVASGLTFPTGIAFDEQGRAHVVESGYSYGEVWTTPRLLRIAPGAAPVVVATGGRNGPWTGVDHHDGAFYVAEGGVLEGGRILRIDADGRTTAIVEGLPSHGDHHTNGPRMGPDGWLYFGQGTATNSGVVGEDNAQFGWLRRRPDFHDVPGADVVLAGQVFETDDVRAPESSGKAHTGGFAPFGETTRTARGRVPCSGAVLRVAPGGGPVELVAWGFRNPFGLAFDPLGRLYVTDNGYDDRGSRPVWGSADHLWRVEPGRWYGWPDYSGGRPLTDPEFRPPGAEPLRFLLAEHPDTPPQPVAEFGVHSSADGLDVSTSPAFGHVGAAFVALLGDEAPATGKTLAPVGFKVVRVDLDTGFVEDFAVNRGRTNGPASRIGGGGLERPVAVRFTPDGSELYVVDFGVLLHDERGAHPREGTGALWRIRRVEVP